MVIVVESIGISLNCESIGIDYIIYIDSDFCIRVLYAAFFIWYVIMSMTRILESVTDTILVCLILG